MAANTDTLRENLIAWYGEIADTERGLGRPEHEAHARLQISRLQYGGVLVAGYRCPDDNLVVFER